VLVHGARVLYESAIITEYVDDLPSSQNKLMFEDPGLRAEVRIWTYWCNTRLKPDLDKFKYGESRFSASDCEGAEERLIQYLNKLEMSLSKSSWLVGEKFSLAEVNVFPFIRQLSRIQPAPEFLNQFPRLNSWREMISKRASVELSLKL
ncbi:MAG: glutathione S-transferase family protein, partial [Pseudomonadota bacterium]